VVFTPRALRLAGTTPPVRGCIKPLPVRGSLLRRTGCRHGHADATGRLTLALLEGTLDLTVGGFRSALRPRQDGDAPLTAYLPVDSPFDSGLTPMTIGLQPGARGRPQVTLTIKDDEGKDLVYPFEPVGAAATPAP